MTDAEVFSAGVYVRLSQEDDGAGRSESIKNQTELVRGYVARHGWRVGGVYADDGWSGTTFDRPGFNRLLEDIEGGKINMVVTKDLSRLGRDYIETGHYVERYFPLHNVRFIAITDGIDTFDKHCAGNDMTPFKAVINDLYAKDISKKIRSALDAKRRSGQFIGAFAPYGYQKHPADKNKLIVDEVAALVVRRIFSMYVNGGSVSGITRALNKERVLPPSAYKALSSAYAGANARTGAWRCQTVRNILSGYVYAGHTVQGKSVKISYKSAKSRKTKREDWIVVENTHEPIVDMETFETVQAMLARRATAGSGTGRPGRHPLAGLLFCGDCGLPVTFRRARNRKFITLCSNYARFGQCRRHAVYEEELNDLVIGDLKRISARVIDGKAFAGRVNAELPERKAGTPGKESAAIDKRLDVVKKAVRRLYEDKAGGVIDEGLFMDVLKSFHEETAALINRRQALAAQPETEPPPSADAALRIAMFDTVSETLLARLIHRVDLFEPGGDEAVKEYKAVVHYTFPAP